MYVIIAVLLLSNGTPSIPTLMQPKFNTLFKCEKFLHEYAESDPKNIFIDSSPMGKVTLFNPLSNGTGTITAVCVSDQSGDDV